MNRKFTQSLNPLRLWAILFLFAGLLKAQTTILKEDFEDADFTGYSTAESKFLIGTADYFARGTNGAPFNFAQNVTGFGGSKFIGLEDLDGAGFVTDPHWLALNAQNISGYSNMSISIKFAAPSTSFVRYEVEDFLTVEYSIDGGAFQKVLDFKGGHNAGGVSVAPSGDRMRQDHDLNGTYTVEVSGGAMQTFTANLDAIKGSAVTGSSMVVRVLFSSIGSQEEMAFDDIELKGTYSASPVSASISAQTDVSCHGESDGSLTATATDGVANFDYVWSNGATTSNTTSTTHTITNLAAGTYTVTITDNNGATSTASSTITQPTAIVASAAVNLALDCNGDSDGRVMASATGGTSPYMYSWNTGGTAALETGLSTGKYYVTITDANGCYDSASVTLTQPTALVASTSVSATIDCNGGSDGKLISSATGGTTPYVYSWSNGGTIAIQSGLSAGTYTVTITDNNGCTSTSSKTLTSPSVLAPGQIQ